VLADGSIEERAEIAAAILADMRLESPSRPGVELKRAFTVLASPSKRHVIPPSAVADQLDQEVQSLSVGPRLKRTSARALHAATFFG
jgi:hypothetical protein